MPTPESSEVTGLISQVKLPSGDVYNIKDPAATTIYIAGTEDTNGNTMFITTPVKNGDEVDY